jgi:hypothetical protein
LIDVVFYYQNSKKEAVRELIIKSLTTAVSTLISLPDHIEICIYKLPHSVYGGIDKYTPNRIGLNSSLALQDIPEILVHELIHVNQRYTKTLEIKNNGTYYWHGVPYHNIMPENLEYDDYKNSPWEVDVDNKLSKLLTEALMLSQKKHLSTIDSESK